MPKQMLEDPMIEEALNLEHLFTLNREERQQYIMSYKAMMDEASREETIRRVSLAEGEARGEARGRAAGKVEMAKRMLAANLALEQIAEFTGLSVSEIEVLK